MPFRDAFTLASVKFRPAAHRGGLLRPKPRIYTRFNWQLADRPCRFDWITFHFALLRLWTAGNSEHSSRPKSDLIALFFCLLLVLRPQAWTLASFLIHCNIRGRYTYNDRIDDDDNDDGGYRRLELHRMQIKKHRLMLFTHQLPVLAVNLGTFF